MPASSTYKSYMFQVMPLLLCCLDIATKPFSSSLLLIITIKASSSIYWFGLTSLPHKSGLNNVLAYLKDLVLYLEYLLKTLCHLHFFEWGRVLASNSFFFFISWRLITLQYCSGFCHTLTWISHGYTFIPLPDPTSHLPLHLIPLGLPSAPGPSICLMH